MIRLLFPHVPAAPSKNGQMTKDKTCLFLRRGETVTASLRFFLSFFFSELTEGWFVFNPPKESPVNS